MPDSGFRVTPWIQASLPVSILLPALRASMMEVHAQAMPMNQNGEAVSRPAHQTRTSPPASSSFHVPANTSFTCHPTYICNAIQLTPPRLLTPAPHPGEPEFSTWCLGSPHPSPKTTTPAPSHPYSTTLIASTSLATTTTTKALIPSMVTHYIRYAALSNSVVTSHTATTGCIHVG